MSIRAAIAFTPFAVAVLVFPAWFYDTASRDYYASRHPWLRNWNR